MKELQKDQLYSFDEKLRIEIGPQVVKLIANDANIDNSITHVNYQYDKIDAIGNVIVKDKLMHCIDWKCLFLPKLWKVYRLQKEANIERFIKINEFEDKAEAFAFAEKTYKEL